MSYHPSRSEFTCVCAILLAFTVVMALVLTGCTGPQLRATLASIEVGYWQSHSDADVGGHVGSSSLTGDAYRGDTDTQSWGTKVSIKPLQGLYMPEQEILDLMAYGHRPVHARREDDDAPDTGQTSTDKSTDSYEYVVTRDGVEVGRASACGYVCPACKAPIK